MGCRTRSSSTTYPHSRHVPLLEGDEFIEHRVAPSIVAAPHPLPPRIIAAPAR